MGQKLRTCVMFENTRFCTGKYMLSMCMTSFYPVIRCISFKLLLSYNYIGKCSNDSECDEDQACDNTFKVCRKKRANGGKCGRDAGCISDNW